MKKSNRDGRKNKRNKNPEKRASSSQSKSKKSFPSTASFSIRKNIKRLSVLTNKQERRS
jgi:hypothetical protein